LDFSLTDEQVLLRDTAKAMLAKECPSTLVRAHIDDISAADPLWAHLREFAGLAAGPCTDLCLFVQETGYVAAPGPFFASTVLFGSVLRAAGNELLDAVAAGETTGTVALAGADGVWRPNDEPVKLFVPEIDRVDWVAIVDAGPRVRLVRTDDLPEPRLIQTVDWSRRLFQVDTSAADTAATPVDGAALEAALDRSTACIAAELVGTVHRLFEMALAYAKERYQFDVPIGAFQAIQHRLADASLITERATAAAQYAAMTVDGADEQRARAAHVAKSAAGAASSRVVKDAAQIHGGIGYTWEHDLHLYMRRAVGSQFWLGSTDWHHDRLADLLFA
jgi:hypothetical protein